MVIISCYLFYMFHFKPLKNSLSVINFVLIFVIINCFRLTKIKICKCCKMKHVTEYGRWLEPHVAIG